jgi:hypothetical protein
MKMMLAGTSALAAFFLQVSTAQAAQPLGRLFTTPQERAQIDSGKTPTDPAAASAPAAGQKLDGIVVRSGGPTVIWVDGVPRYLPTGAAKK